MGLISDPMSLLKSADFKDIIGNDGTIAPPSSNLYTQLSAALDHAIKPKYVYTILKLNRYNTYKDLLSFRNIKVENNDSNITESTIDTLNNSNTMSFSINISDIWPQISDEKVKYIIILRIVANVIHVYCGATHGRVYCMSEYIMRQNCRVHLVSNVRKYQKLGFS